MSCRHWNTITSLTACLQTLSTMSTRKSCHKSSFPVGWNAPCHAQFLEARVSLKPMDERNIPTASSHHLWPHLSMSTPSAGSIGSAVNFLARYCQVNPSMLPYHTKRYWNNHQCTRYYESWSLDQPNSPRDRVITSLSIRVLGVSMHPPWV